MRLFSIPFRSLGFVALFAAAVWADQPATSPAKPKDELVAVKRGDLSLSVSADGWFEPIEPLEVRLRPKAFQGELKVEAAVPHGSAVKAGEIVLKVKSEELERQVASAENELGLARANLAKAEADVKLGDESDGLAMKVQEEAVASAENSLQWWEKVDGPHQLKQLQLQEKQFADSVEDQQDELDQLRAMYKSEELTNATADIVVKRAVRQLERVQTMLGMSKERGEKVKATDYEDSRRRVLNALEQQKQAMAALQAAQAQSKAQRAAALFAAKAAYESASRKAGDLRADLAAFAVGAPADGVVYYGTLNQGAWQNNSPRALGRDDKIAPDQIVMTVAAPGRLRFVAAVPEDQIGRVSKGDSAVITPKAFPEMQFKGECLAPPPSSTIGGEPPKYELRVAVESVDPKLRPGQKASVKIDAQDAKSVLMVPLGAVSGGKVSVEKSGGVQHLDVVTGRASGDMIEIISGVKEGEKVYSTFKKE